eukprot:3822317-Heterocapsa_arctica.AAC.1
MGEICYGLDHMVYQAGARSAGTVLLAELGLHRGAYNMDPPRHGNSEEITFQLASTVNKDGHSYGQYHVMTDNGATYGKTMGQIGYIVNIVAALRAGVTLYRTPMGTFSVTYGGVDACLICA